MPEEEIDSTNPDLLSKEGKELAETGIDFWEAVRTEPHPPSPTPFEQSPSIRAEILKSLGFFENERLRMYRVRLTNFLRTVDEPPSPENEYDDIEYPEDLIYLVRNYQETGETLVEERPTRDRARARGQIGLELTLSQIFYEGGWINEARRRVAEANLYADNERVKFPGLFGKVVEATQKPQTFEDSEPSE